VSDALPQEPVTVPTGAFAMLPDPAEAGSLDDLVERLRRLKVWAGDPSYETIKDRVNEAWTAAGRPASELARRSTVANCFQPGRRRFNTDLVVAVVQALHPDVGYVTQWRQALRVIGGETDAVAQVRVQDTLPQDLDTFTGRISQLDRLRLAAREGRAVVISAIEGMAGVGKTQLAVHAGHLLIQDNAVDRVLFVNLRGFHPDRTQPPADPAAVLDGFLRLLGVPGHQIPHDLAARSAAYRDRLAGTRTLVVLDNASGAEQVRPLLAGAAGCLTLVTSRRSLADLQPAIQLAVDAFTPDEALSFLAGAVTDVPVGPDPDAASRIARRCGYLPLALSLITGHIRGTPGWTLTDHADRLDERHRDRRLDTGVELALDLSYQHLPAGQRRLLRLAALHPGQDFDAYAAAALAGTDLRTARQWLHHLRRDHLLQQAGPDRYTFHDLVRAFATSRAHDQDPPPERHAALTRLFDHYLATSAAAMNALHPAEAHRRPQIPPTDTPAPDLTGPGADIAWLDTERHTLVVVAAHTAAHGWPGHTIRLARVLYRYLQGGYNNEALTVHGHALRAGRDSGDVAGQAHALTGLGIAHLRMGRTGWGTDCLRQSLDLFRQIDDPVGRAFALYNLGVVAQRTGRHEAAVDCLEQALELYRQAGDRTGESLTLNGLGIVMEKAGRFPEAIDYCRQALALARQAGNQYGEAFVLNSLGVAETRAGRDESAGDHLRQALGLFRELRNRTGEAGVLDSLGLLHTRIGRPGQAVEYHRQALAIVRDVGDQDAETHILNGLGEAALAAGRPGDALTHHTAAVTIATEIGVDTQAAYGHIGLGHTHRVLGDAVSAREHYQQALVLFTDLGLPEADQARAGLAELDATAAERR
jgi:tetratricopeptide (TPR) repeat protein